MKMSFTHRINLRCVFSYLGGFLGLRTTKDGYVKTKYDKRKDCIVIGSTFNRTFLYKTFIKSIKLESRETGMVHTGIQGFGHIRGGSVYVKQEVIVITTINDRELVLVPKNSSYGARSAQLFISTVQAWVRG